MANLNHKANIDFKKYLVNMPSKIVFSLMQSDFLAMNKSVQGEMNL